MVVPAALAHPVQDLVRIPLRREEQRTAEDVDCGVECMHKGLHSMREHVKVEVSKDNQQQAREPPQCHGHLFVLQKLVVSAAPPTGVTNQMAHVCEALCSQAEAAALPPKLASGSTAIRIGSTVQSMAHSTDAIVDALPRRSAQMFVPWAAGVGGVAAVA
eukprot:CAMPEP_0181200028 /NCGR_PEP_ID=MMETSP1096-20121128/17522_1 /TAXON_ID=156174 ORGANISM="Chrysochromulina ericina, Strain CCMP281" /NCGR_SAMPLE_ID=MMETSP1096 /ASSEMBLY_ACC=CAM_ASM_000453 /LENGTH=159 /DNA_ID=CAMNT_0023290311 /DNA_START=576 /DNA_END=1056 /DNA_ORIENTATION=-